MQRHAFEFVRAFSSYCSALSLRSVYKIALFAWNRFSSAEMIPLHEARPEICDAQVYFYLFIYFLADKVIKDYLEKKRNKVNNVTAHNAG